MQPLIVKAKNRTEAFKLAPWAVEIHPVKDLSDDLHIKYFICFDSEMSAQIWLTYNHESERVS